MGRQIDTLTLVVAANGMTVFALVLFLLHVTWLGLFAWLVAVALLAVGGVRLWRDRRMLSGGKGGSA